MSWICHSFKQSSFQQKIMRAEYAEIVHKEWLSFSSSFNAHFCSTKSVKPFDSSGCRFTRARQLLGTGCIGFSWIRLPPMCFERMARQDSTRSWSASSPYHSALSATIGSTFVARRAGRRLAAIATIARIAGAAESATGSAAPTP
jgi:hypothetical protein